MLNTVFTNDVRQTLDHFRRSVDQMFENFYGFQGQPAAAASGPKERTWSFSPVLETGWNDNFLHVRAILPGVSDKDVQVTVQNNQLLIQGERKMPEGFDKNASTALAYGSFYTALALPNGLDLEHVNCRLSNGILEIQVPILEASKPKQIQIQTGPAQKSIGA
jgi:HSP20 family protein